MTNQLYLWDATISCRDTPKGDVFSFMRAEASRWTFQKEKGKADGYEHWQTRFSLNKKSRRKGVVIMMRSHGIKIAEDAVTPTTNAVAENKLATFSYVMKEDTRIDGPWTDKMDRKQKTAGVRWLDDDRNFKPWMNTVLESMKTYDHRAVNVLIDKTGNLGKTNFEDWCEFYDHSFAIWWDDKIEYMMNEAYANPGQKTYTIGLPRALDKKDMKQFWTLCERLKDGRLSDGRYKAKRVRVERPHIWIYTNWCPEFSQLSVDRWKFWCVDDDDCLVEYDYDSMIEN